MANEKEMEGYYKSGYLKLLDELRVLKYEHPEAYDVVAQITRNYRSWVSQVASIDNLPEVPSK